MTTASGRRSTGTDAAPCVTKQDEFRRRSSRSMQEGLVLLDQSGAVLSINRTPPNGCSPPATSASERTSSPSIASRRCSRAIQQALADGHSEIRRERGGRVYQFDLSRIDSDGANVGAVLLAFDITEAEFAEQQPPGIHRQRLPRAEDPASPRFPGSAELIENGMVASDDVPRLRRPASARALHALVHAYQRHHPAVSSWTSPALEVLFGRRSTSTRVAEKVVAIDAWSMPPPGEDQP